MIQAVVEVRCDIIRMKAFRSFTCGVVGCEGPVIAEDLIGLVGDGARRLVWILTRHDEKVVVLDERESSAVRNEIK